MYFIENVQVIYGRAAIWVKISSISFDKGFWSKENKSLLQTAIPYVIMPKKGKLNLEEKEEEHSNIFKKQRKKHSAVESNINELEQHGLNRCPDKGLHRFKTNTALGGLSYNLKRFSKILLKAKEIKELEEAKQKQAA